MISINWKVIRPIERSQATGFEELCAQLARREHPNGFIRKGAPDAGVECYAINDDGTEEAWQAKYFDALGESQWGQLDESVKAALGKHPKLTRYTICVPYDRPDARIAGQKSALEKWNEHVAKWEGWAAARGMSVEFPYCGSSELIEKLSQPEQAGLVGFWFDTAAFAAPWFHARLQEALHSAGPRYTPELNIGLSIAEDLEKFGRTQQFFDTTKALSKEIRSETRHLRLSRLNLAEEARAKADRLEACIQTISEAFGTITPEPAGDLTLGTLIDLTIEAGSLCEELREQMEELEQETDAKAAEELPVHRYSQSENSIREVRSNLWKLERLLRRTQERLQRDFELASGRLLVLKGKAGTGKTHLLCDLARRRLDENRPTVLLMGQRFLTPDEPWAQALQQLDLAGTSTNEFVGALEAAAQAANCRALVIVDAVNEGAGRVIWPNHLEAFLAHLARSPWIGTILSVRTSYEAIVLPDTVRGKSVTLEHRGFDGQEYDALKSFFLHYGLELPSAPLLNPEFSNPLFLKTLCIGLRNSGVRRLPRGYQGITSIFDTYINAAHNSLAKNLDFAPNVPLVRKALDLLATEYARRGERWMPLEEAMELANRPLPGRDYHRSLYRGLLDEGLLIEDAGNLPGNEQGEIVYIGYERLADHLIAKSLLDTRLSPSNPRQAFLPDGGLAFLVDTDAYIPVGLIEALSIQLPERTGHELVELVPELTEHWGMGDAFRQSIVWRSTSAFSEETLRILNNLNRTEQDWDDTMDTLLTVATLPDHPYNADFLDGWLRQKSMPERDEHWSTYLHRAWRETGAVHRIVDWAAAVKANAELDEEAVRLCAITLAWMLATANRFLRDRATKALVSLHTRRIPKLINLIEAFKEVDDPYIAERVYAVAYGVAMRSNAPAPVGKLAAAVYANIFERDTPPAHILLRDYARGVCERALWLKSPLAINTERIRPPYGSTWPNIPTEEDISRMTEGWKQAAYDGGGAEWARSRIVWSVESDDFARYVIGTNSGYPNWLSLRLDEPRWMPEKARLEKLVSDFSVDERDAWEVYDFVSKNLSDLYLQQRLANFRRQYPKEGESDEEASSQDDPSETEDAIIRTRELLDQASSALDAVLTATHRNVLRKILEERDSGGNKAPRFDLKIIQRYVLWRVFDLGWTTERFGKFDRYEIGYDGREAHKAERIGKKYQWIAYHEIIALIADNYQYLPLFDEGGGEVYPGAWQGWYRNLDPSCTLTSTPGGTSWEGHELAWWAPEPYERWAVSESPESWANTTSDLPKPEAFLSVIDPRDGSRWVNLYGYYNWKQKPPADRKNSEVERREVWYICTGYLLQATDTEAFMKWAKEVDFWGRWMPDLPEEYHVFLGEHAWSLAAREQFDDGSSGWRSPGYGCPVSVQVAAIDYTRESAGFDCSVDTTYSMGLPNGLLISALGLEWSGHNAQFLDAHGKLAAYDPTCEQPGPSAILVRETLLREKLGSQGLSLCWTILGEKRTLPGGFDRERYPSLRMTGAYVLTPDEITGFINTIPD